MKALGVLAFVLGSSVAAQAGVSLTQKNAVVQSIESAKLACRDQHNSYYDSSFVVSKVEDASSSIQKGAVLIFTAKLSDVKVEKTTVVTDGAKVTSVVYETYNYEFVWPSNYDWVVEDVVTCK
ncbi:MAG: hypothetical protein ACM3MG_11350 [Bacillota bacterium]